MPEVKVNDLDIHYEANDFRSPREASEKAWTQHGFGRSGRFWFHWVPPLCGSYRVLRVDMRGHGRSGDPPDSYAWTVDATVSMVLTL